MAWTGSRLRASRGPCRLGLAALAVTASLLPAASAAGAKHQPFRFRGKTSQKLDVSFQVPWSFVGVRKFVIGWDSKCTSGATFDSGSHTSGTIPLDRHFRWHERGAYTYTEVSPGYSAAGGRTLNFGVVVSNSGVLPDNARPKGTWRATTTVSDATTGQPIDTCRTGKVTWKADLL